MALRSEQEVMGNVAEENEVFDPEAFEPSAEPAQQAAEPVQRTQQAEPEIEIVEDKADKVHSKIQSRIAAKAPTYLEEEPLPEDTPKWANDMIARRINKATAAANVARRAAEEKAAQAENYARQVHARLEQAERGFIGQQIVTVNTDKQRVEAQLAGVEQLMKQVLTRPEGALPGDPDLLIKAQREQALLAIQKRDLDRYREPAYNGPNVPAPPVAAQQQEEAPPKPCAEFLLWKERNSWFDQSDNPELSQYATAVDAKLRESDLDPTSPEWFNAIDRALRAKFPAQFDDGDGDTRAQAPARPNPAQPRRSVVAPSSRTSSTATKPSKLTMSASDVAEADRFRPRNGNWTVNSWRLHYLNTRNQTDENGSMIFET